MYRNNIGIVVIIDRLNIFCINNFVFMFIVMKGLFWVSFIDDFKVCLVGLFFFWLFKVKLLFVVYLLVFFLVV